MVKLLDEFPQVHQTFNLVPSLITQIQDYVTGAARDPFLEVAAKPAQDLTPDERRFALQYLFQANPVNLIGRYPRYQQLLEHFRNAGGTPGAAEKYFSVVILARLLLMPTSGKMILHGKAGRARSKTYISPLSISNTIIISYSNTIAEFLRGSRWTFPSSRSSSAVRPRAPLLTRCRQTVSHAICGQPDHSQAEDELGEALFDRSSREGVLTDAGKVLYEYAEKLINLRSEATESLGELRELQKGRLVVAANEFTVLYLLTVLAEFRRLHPMIKIKVERALGSHIPDEVLRYSVEFGVLSYEPQEPNLHSVVILRPGRVGFCGFPKKKKKKAPSPGFRTEISIRQLGAESFVAHIVSSPYREKVIQLFKSHKTPLHMDLELPTLQAIKQYVATGNGVAFLPEISVETEIARGELVRIPVRELQLKRKLRLIYRKDANLSHAARAFLKVVEALALERKGRYRFQRES